jgi:hypothetical protein
MEGRTPRILVSAALIVVLLVAAAYLGLIFAQGDRSYAVTVAFVTTYLVLMAAMLGVSLSTRPGAVALRTPLRAGAAGGLLILGILSVFSFGLPLIVAGGLAGGAAVRTLARPLWTRPAMLGVGAAFLAVAVLVAGFEISGRMILCPAKGLSGGSGYMLVSGGYHWTCVDGKLTFASGFCSGSGGGIDANGRAFATNNC